MFEFQVEGCPIVVYVSKHAHARMRQRRVNRYVSFGSIVALGEKLLDMKHGEEFCIMDKEHDISVVCGLHARGCEISVEIITVLDSSQFYVKEGVRVYKLAA